MLLVVSGHLLGGRGGGITMGLLNYLGVAGLLAGLLGEGAGVERAVDSWAWREAISRWAAA